MIVDSSALVALLRGEPRRAEVTDALLAADSVSMSAAAYVETGIVIDRRGGPVVSRRFDELVGALRIGIADVTQTQARIARAAYRDFGKGSGHPAGLNFGDCFSYALAIERAEPLLYVGDDFGHTDVRSVL